MQKQKTLPSRWSFHSKDFSLPNKYENQRLYMPSKAQQQLEQVIKRSGIKPTLYLWALYPQLWLSNLN